MTINSVVIGIFIGVLLWFAWGAIHFFRRYRIAQKNWSLTSEKLREAIQLAGNYEQLMDEYKEIVDKVVEKYPDAREFIGGVLND